MMTFALRTPMLHMLVNSLPRSVEVSDLPMRRHSTAMTPTLRVRTELVVITRRPLSAFCAVPAEQSGLRVIVLVLTISLPQPPRVI